MKFIFFYPAEIKDLISFKQFCGANNIHVEMNQLSARFELFEEAENADRLLTVFRNEIKEGRLSGRIETETL